MHHAGYKKTQYIQLYTEFIQTFYTMNHYRLHINIHKAEKVL